MGLGRAALGNFGPGSRNGCVGMGADKGKPACALPPRGRPNVEAGTIASVGVVDPVFLILLLGNYTCPNVKTVFTWTKRRVAIMYFRTERVPVGGASKVGAGSSRVLELAPQGTESLRAEDGAHTDIEREKLGRWCRVRRGWQASREQHASESGPSQLFCFGRSGTMDRAKRYITPD